VNVGGACLRLSEEHDRLEWLDFEAAQQRLIYDSNKNALWELRERLESDSTEPGTSSPEL